MAIPDEAVIAEPLQRAIDEYAQWSAQQLEIEQAKTVVDVPLYHYTDWTD
ncbi:MAG TPA: hypothetical protein VFW28_12300 [Micropepsaceae bacterium]|nr:hypothetical protein [Micropepsaceae bacterium]